MTSMAPQTPNEPAAATGSIELSVVVPTFNERDNIRELVARLEQALTGVAWEVIFVDDDSPDGTPAEVLALAREDRRVRLLHRIGRRGLSSACIEGMLSSCAPHLAIMDADLQHDETILPQMLEALRERDLDVVIGSRYVPGGSVGTWQGSRHAASVFATKLSALVLRADLKDPMSGFFMLRRELLLEVAHNLSGIGFKILVDIFATARRPLRFAELPYTFRTRQAGESKLDSVAAWQYIMLLLDKSVGRYVPVRFIPFALVGGLGIFVHLAVLWVLYDLSETSFVLGQSAATMVAMTFNFLVNNAFTYRDRRLRGWAMLRGWLSFTVACSVGAIANVGIATYLFHTTPAGGLWWIVSALAGIVVGAVWNYAVTSVYTWNKPKTG